MKPVIALVGRPNVGKSTLFNRLTRTRDALVADFPGLTRDRKFGEGKVGERPYIVVDTGGIGENDDGIDIPMTRQAEQAVKDADIILFMVDGRAGLTAVDEQLADVMRRERKPVYLVVNKTDGIDADTAMADFYSLGLTDVLPIAAAHGRGVHSMIDQVLEHIPFDDDERDELAGIDGDDQDSDETDEHGDEISSDIRVAVLGRPNVGKSTLINRMLGEERVVVFDHAGTTRDTIDVPFERDGRAYTLVDTAGIRRRGRVSDMVEKFSVIKALQAIENAHVVILVIDAREGITDQDLSLLGRVLELGRALLIAINKWDGLDTDHKAQVRNELSRRLEFVPWARTKAISALHGTGVGDLWKMIDKAHASAFYKVNTNTLTRMLEDIVASYPPPRSGRFRAKLRYAHMGGSNPPTLVIHGNRTEALPASYQRYLENRFRELFKLEGSPLRLEFKSGDNPYEGKKNALTERQARHRKRMIERYKR